MIHIGDCLEVMKTLPAESIDAIVTDPPYGLSFMGKDWDHGIPGEPLWREALRVAKPGTHLLAFGGTRTFHRLTCAIEDAGWEIRDCIMWVYGSGFPKSHDVSKAIDRESLNLLPRGKGFNAAGEGGRTNGGDKHRSDHPDFVPYEPATPLAQQWQGWGTALKPAWEPIIVARKPLAGTVAKNVQEYGTGAVNVDGCRIATSELTPRNNKIGQNGWKNSSGGYIEPSPLGRWPANLIHDGSDEVTGLFPVTGPSNVRRPTGEAIYGGNSLNSTVTSDTTVRGVSDNGGSAARFFYCAKASKADRDEGNRHPTVKPTSLMRYLCRLVTPPGGMVLDPFCGSGSTGKAAALEGFRFIGIELNPEYAEIARAREAKLGLEAVK